ncbi:MAG TPA: hypothetical protein VKG43_14745 [Acidimicrobiales bacterium]|nr:hypothetical protein [Acidimicrobiales bacterium]
MTDEIRLEMQRHGGGITDFTIEGLVMGRDVRARWDGEWLVISDTLHRVLEVARTVEAVFVELGVHEPLSRDDEPARLAVEIMRSLDRLTLLEYGPSDREVGEVG